MKKIIALCAAVCIIFTACGTTEELNSERMTQTEVASQGGTDPVETEKTITETSKAEIETSKDEIAITETTAAETKAPKEDKAVHLDYGDVQSFEAALNTGEALQGKTVRFTADELHPDSKYGYNIWSGEHLNFISDGDPNVQVGDVLTAKVVKTEKVLDSWLITYEFVRDATEDGDTITAEKAETKAEKKDEEKPAESKKNTDDKSSQNTYDKNEYYDIVEVSGWVNSIGDTVIVHKVKAKKNVGISASVIAYAEDGSVIGKSSDDITLTEGEYNYFSYYFNGDISDAKFKYSASAKKDSVMSGERSAVEMEQYNKTEDNLYITFRQVKDEIGPFAKFKLLLYKGDKMVGAEDGYFSTYAENLNAKDSTDVAELCVYGVDFDRVEYIFEP